MSRSITKQDIMRAGMTATDLIGDMNRKDLSGDRWLYRKAKLDGVCEVLSAMRVSNALIYDEDNQIVGIKIDGRDFYAL